MSTNKPSAVIRLFVDGVFDESSAFVVDAHTHTIPGVIGCRVSPSGLCTVQFELNASMADSERLLVEGLTFGK
jgi:hypothetical protein